MEIIRNYTLLFWCVFKEIPRVVTNKLQTPLVEDKSLLTVLTAGRKQVFAPAGGRSLPLQVAGPHPCRWPVLSTCWRCVWGVDSSSLSPPPDEEREEVPEKTHLFLQSPVHRQHTDLTLKYPSKILPLAHTVSGGWVARWSPIFLTTSGHRQGA